MWQLKNENIVYYLKIGLEGFVSYEFCLKFHYHESVRFRITKSDYFVEGATALWGFHTPSCAVEYLLTFEIILETPDILEEP